MTAAVRAGSAAAGADQLHRCIAEQAVEEWDDEVRGRLCFATIFSGDETPTRSLTSGLAMVPPGGWLGLHRHDPTETYFVLDGTGTLTLDGSEIPLAPGSSVLIPGGAEHGVRNDGDETLRVFYVFAADSMSDITYRFSADPSA